MTVLVVNERHGRLYTILAVILLPLKSFLWAFLDCFLLGTSCLVCPVLRWYYRGNPKALRQITLREMRFASWCADKVWAPLLRLIFGYSGLECLWLNYNRSTKEDASTTIIDTDNDLIDRNNGIGVARSRLLNYTQSSASIASSLLEWDKRHENSKKHKHDNHDQDMPSIIISNHLSFFDWIFVLGCAWECGHVLFFIKVKKSNLLEFFCVFPVHLFD